jgi:MFS family permease
MRAGCDGPLPRVKGTPRVPATVSILLVTRGLRGFVDGLVSVLLVGHLMRLGFSSLQVGSIVTGTLLGSAALTLAVGLVGQDLGERRVLLWAAVIMGLTGIGFAMLSNFWVLLVVAVIGTLNPLAGDVSVFLPTEQALLAHAGPMHDRTKLFARYNVVGSFAGGAGALASGGVDLFTRGVGLEAAWGERGAFGLYALAALAVAVLYRRLPTPRRPADFAERVNAPLARSRPVVVRLAMLFSLDSFGGGFVVQSLVVLWLYRRFGLSVGTTGTVLFVAGLLGAASQFLSPWLAQRIGLVRTMVYTHLPANLLLILAGVAPTAPWAVTFLLLRSLLSQMDVPARQAYVMAVVPPEERAAAASVTNVPRSLAAALPPLAAGYLLDHSTFGWPLICAGTLKALYDVLLLLQFRSVTPQGESSDGGVGRT